MAWSMTRWGWVLAVGLLPTGRLAAAAEVEVVNTRDCDDWFASEGEGWIALPPAAENIALGAVLPLPVSLGRFGGGRASLDFLAVEVTASDGCAVPGVVESLHSSGQYVSWRPEEALSLGEVYEARLFADNEALRRRLPLVDGENFEELWSFTVLDEPPTVIDWEAVEVVAEYVIVESISSGAGLVCCDEAYPTFDTKSDCIDLGGTCGSRSARGEFRGAVELGPHPALGGFNTAVDISSWSDASGSACATVTRTNRTDGSEDEREFCLELEGTLGQLADYDVEARLAEVCEGVPYTCAAGESADWGYKWDPEQCEPGTGQEAEDTGPSAGPDDSPDAAADLEPGTGGCGCSARSTPPPLSLLGMLLLVAGLRRRRQPAGTSSSH